MLWPLLPVNYDGIVNLARVPSKLNGVNIEGAGEKKKGPKRKSFVMLTNVNETFRRVNLLTRFALFFFFTPSSSHVTRHATPSHTEP